MLECFFLLFISLFCLVQNSYMLALLKHVSNI